MFAGQTDLRITSSVYTAGYYSTGWNGSLQRIIKYSGNKQQAYFIRLSEMHLLQAEVFTKKGQLTQALTALEAIWNQAGDIAPVYTGALDQEAVMKLVLRENYMELSAEFGQEWQFLVRNDMVEDYRPLSRITGENFYVLPIPTKEIINNSLMVQNPGQETN